jgi:DNA-binding CsgD family transcriptional regulator
MQRPTQPLAMSGPKLAPHEERVARLLATGMSNKGIAVALSVSPDYVRGVNTALYRKLDVKNRTEFVIKFLDYIQRSESVGSDAEQVPWQSVPIKRTIESTFMGYDNDESFFVSFLFAPINLIASLDIESVADLLYIDPIKRIDLEEFRVDNLNAISGDALEYLSQGLGLSTEENTKRSRNIVAKVLQEKLVVIEASPPHVTDLISILRTGSGAALGAYIGYTVRWTPSAGQEPG